MVKTNSASPVVVLKARAKEFDFSKLRADENYISVNPGQATYEDIRGIEAVNFVINGKKIDKAFLIAFEKGTADSALHRHAIDMILQDNSHGTISKTLGDYITKAKKEKETSKQTQPLDMQLWSDWKNSQKSDEFNKSWEDEFNKAYEDYCSNEFNKVWQDHCDNPFGITEDQRTDAYKETLRRFYNAGREYGCPPPEKIDVEQDYRPFVRGAFQEMFKYAQAGVPNNFILEELAVSCNRRWRDNICSSSSYFDAEKLFLNSNIGIDKVIQINCSNSNSVKVECEDPVVEVSVGYLTKKICDISCSLKFTLESQDNINGVAYKDGRLSLVIPQKLRNYKEEGKNLFDIIKEYFQKCCEKLGFTFETKVEHDLGNQLKVDSHGHLENMESPVHNNNRVR